MKVLNQTALNEVSGGMGYCEPMISLRHLQGLQKAAHHEGMMAGVIFGGLTAATGYGIGLAAWPTIPLMAAVAGFVAYKHDSQAFMAEFL